MREYDGVKGLAEVTPIVVLVRAERRLPLVPLTARGAPKEFTLTDVTVVRSFRGSREGEILRVRQFGRTPVDVTPPLTSRTEFPPALAVGTTYLLFLFPFYFEKGKPTGDLYPTGSRSVYAVPAADAARAAAGSEDVLLQRTAGESPDLPAQVSLGEVASIVATVPPTVAADSNPGVD